MLDTRLLCCISLGRCCFVLKTKVINKISKNPSKYPTGRFWAYVGQPHGHISWATSISTIIGYFKGFFKILMITLVSSPKQHLPKDMQHSVSCCLLFFHRYPSGYECSQANPGIIQLRNAPWPPEESRRWLSYSICIGEVVWSFMFAVELAGSYLGHVPCKFWKVGLGLSIFHRSVMGEIDLLWPRNCCFSVITLCSPQKYLFSIEIEISAIVLVWCFRILIFPICIL